MAFQYHARALLQDASSDYGFVVGGANIGVVRRRAEERKRAAVPQHIDEAVAKLDQYFSEVRTSVGEEAFALAAKQEIDGEMLSDEESAIVAKAMAKPRRTTISRTEAEQLAKAIAEGTKSWGD